MPFRAGHSFGRLSLPSTPIIAGTPRVGDTAIVTQSGAPAINYTRFIGGIAQNTITLPYTYIAADIGPLFSLVANGVGGHSSESNRIQFTSLSQLNVAPRALYDRQNLTLVSSSHISSQGDSSGNSLTSLTQGTDSSRPTFGTAYINGVPGIQYSAQALVSGPTVAQLLSDPTKIWMLVPIEIVNNGPEVTSASTGYKGATIMASTDNELSLKLGLISGAPKVLFTGTGATLAWAAADVGISGTHLIRARKTGTTAGVIVDGATEATAVVDSSISPTNGTLQTGTTAGSLSSLSAIVGDIAIWPQAPSANDISTASAFYAYLYSSPESSWL